MTTRLFVTEFWRMVSRKGTWLIVVLVAVIVAYKLFEIGPSGNVSIGGVKTVRLFGAFGLNGAEVYALATPIVAGLVSAGSLAADRNHGYPTLILVRGFSRTRYMTIKAAAMATAAGFANLASCVLAVVVASTFLPWGSSTLIGSLKAEPLVGVFSGHALLYDIAVMALLSLAAASLALSGLVVGVVAANPWAAAATPMVVVVGPELGLGYLPMLDIVSPNSYVDLFVYSFLVPLEWWPFAAPVYWFAFGSACVVAGLVIFSIKEPY